jgi:putative salt-induced outer membrane protein YdiY
MLKIIIVFTVFFLPSSAMADWVMLQNGDRLSGTVTEKSAEGVTINTDALGKITIPKNRIASVHQGNAPRVMARELRTGQPMSMNNIAQASTTPSSTIAETQPEKEVKEAEQKQDGKYKWSGRISAGGQLEDGNNNSKSLSADADIKARDEKNRFAFGGEANWAEEEGEKTDNDQQIYGSYDRFLTNKWFIGGRQSFEKDEFEELDLRSQTGLFAGYQFYERDDLNLQVKAGPEYIYEDFENGDSESDIALSWALDYDQKLFEEAIEIFHKHEIAAPFADTGAFLLESESGIRMPVGKVLDASLQVDFDWDNDPAPGVRENDTTYGLKLGYGW